MYKIQNENSAIKTKRVNLILVSDRISQEEKTKQMEKENYGIDKTLLHYLTVQYFILI